MINISMISFFFAVCKVKGSDQGAIMPFLARFYQIVGRGAVFNFSQLTQRPSRVDKIFLLTPKSSSLLAREREAECSCQQGG